MVSLNLAEDGAIELGSVLLECGIGIEAGVFTLAVMPAPTGRSSTSGLAAGVDVRVGLEDTLIGRDGGPAPGNAAQVAETAPRMP